MDGREATILNFSLFTFLFSLEPISKIPMRGNGSDFVSYRGARALAWPKPRRGEATKRGDKS
ncbi:hypothetical protein, partial [Hydrogenimonas sp.]